MDTEVKSGHSREDARLAPLRGIVPLPYSTWFALRAPRYYQTW
ncbi:hypothetical protein HMF8227_02856 [Saliniradius amylolyticus]|uniref:Uncharacterized protein n=1 Tax=Saliniradius amylolyticus TaxID=2183582 RepID=A0A2S2E6M3_9ALTE|nr:hypothetical protein HMF8227_02856 [Saliniradius amylolyticus]